MPCHHHLTSCEHEVGSHRSCVSLVPIFNHLEAEQMDEIMETVQAMSYKKGEIIYRADEPSDALYIINKGKVRIYRLSETGKEQLVRMLNPGDFTGEHALFSKSLHESYAEAIMDTSICFIRGSDLQAFLLKYPTISLKILAEFSARLEQVERQTTRFTTEKVETRIALFLVEYMDNKNIVELPMSKKDLASYLGTSPETISRKFADLEVGGYMKRKSNKRIEILDLDGLLLV